MHILFQAFHPRAKWKVSQNKILYLPSPLSACEQIVSVFDVQLVSFQPVVQRQMPCITSRSEMSQLGSVLKTDLFY